MRQTCADFARYWDLWCQQSNFETDFHCSPENIFGKMFPAQAPLSLMHGTVSTYIYNVGKDQPFHINYVAQIQLKQTKLTIKGILFYEILMDCFARKRMQKTTSNYLKWFPRYCDLNFYMLSH